MIKWPEKKNKLRSDEQWDDEYARAWNAAIDACQKAYEKTQGETDNDLAFQKGYAAGVKAHGKGLVALDYQTVRLIIDLGALIGRPYGDARDIQRVIALWPWPEQVKEKMLKIINFNDSKDTALGNIIRFICSTFGTPPRDIPKELIHKGLSKCKAWQALYLDAPAEIMENAEHLIVQAIHARLTGGKS